MRITVLDAATLGADLDLSALSALGEAEIYSKTSGGEIVSRLQGADVAILNKVKLTEEILASLPSLRLICITATGYDNVDVQACRKLGIAVCNVAGYSSQSVAQLTLAMALSLYTHLPEYDTHVKNGAYTRGGVQNCLTPVYHELAGKTWGIIGFGNIGQAVGTVARAMGCRVIVHRRHAAEGFENVSLDELYAQSDIISLHVPLTEQTRGMISRQALSRMKRGVMLINVARGAVLDEAAVADAVIEGQIGFFGCDVYSHEPYPVGHPFSHLLNRKNVCLTPHMAWGSYESRVRCLDEVIANIRAFERGELRNRVDVAKGTL
ncbi:MAG: D-2-hydroxyacid dehydrogenase [Clostridia bacterium]|nr:D-2-hydroxyacid dehydrogenase [Clostridia bacterium]